MYLKRLTLRNFRNYHEHCVEFDPHLNVIFGKNAQGKTSLLEAIYLLTVGKSFRTSRQQEMIHHNEMGFYVKAEFERNGIEQTLSYELKGTHKSIVHNNTPCSSVIQILGLLPSVIMPPDDDLIKGPPASRRLFLDIHISQCDPLYTKNLSRYNRALKQRNAQLKSEQTGGIEVWEQELAQAAAYITMKRKETLESLQTIANDVHYKLSGDSNPLQLEYLPKSKPIDSLEDVKQFYITYFATNRHKELILGTTMTGTHREDFKVSIGNEEARAYGSEGQKRTCVATLRLAAWHRLKDLEDSPPLMLIDDLGANLDESRRNNLLDYTQTLGQVLITSTLKPEEASKLKPIAI